MLPRAMSTAHSVNKPRGRFVVELGERNPRVLKFCGREHTRNRVLSFAEYQAPLLGKTDWCSTPILPGVPLHTGAHGSNVGDTPEQAAFHGSFKKRRAKQQVERFVPQEVAVGADTLLPKPTETPKGETPKGTNFCCFYYYYLLCGCGCCSGSFSHKEV